MSYQKSAAVVGGREISIETGRLAKQADGSVLVSSGDDRVLVTVVSSDSVSEQDFFPLKVEYQEKFYAGGRIPGGFFKREGRPSSLAVLSARMMDRPIRPCFPKGYQYDTQIVASVLSYSGEYPVEMLASIGASSALHISDIPFSGPLASIQVARLEGELIFNPTPDQALKSDINFILSGTKKGILMVEGSAEFVSEKSALSALKAGHEALQPLLDMQEDLRQKTGSKPKRKWEPVVQESDQLKTQIEDWGRELLQKALHTKDKKERYKAFKDLAVQAEEKFDSDEDKKMQIHLILEEMKYRMARDMILTSQKRIDGRKLNEVRPIACQTGLLPRVHGSSLFTRGETQVLGAVTLGTEDDEQILDTLSGEGKKKFLLHYNFPPFCVGEIGRLGGQSRREIGHGFLAEKALEKIIPSVEEFPYTIRIVSEVLESNGSSSMGTVCAGSMALMDSAVPVRCPIAGIAMGLIQEDSRTAILSDILGDEDHLGDMDFKVAGSKDGITAIQMDLKIDSLSFDVMEQALEQAREGRLHILSCMNEVISEKKSSLSKYAPRIEMMKIHPDKIREVIGSGGKMINSIINKTGVKINIDDDGVIHLCSPDSTSIKKAKDIIDKICEDAEIGKIYEGEVKKIVEFGAFVEILPNTQGLVHISEIANKRIDRVQNYLKEGQSVRVKVLDIQNGKIRLSIKAVEK